MPPRLLRIRCTIKMKTRAGRWVRKPTYLYTYLPWQILDLNINNSIRRLQTYQRIRANRQRRLKLRTRKRHHTVESMLGYDLEEERREERPRDVRSYDNEDEPVDVEGDSLGWPEPPINVDGN